MGLAAFMYALGMAMEVDMVDGLRRGVGLDITQMGDGKDGQNGERSESRGERQLWREDVCFRKRGGPLGEGGKYNQAMRHTSKSGPLRIRLTEGQELLKDGGEAAHQDAESKDTTAGNFPPRKRQWMPWTD